MGIVEALYLKRKGNLAYYDVCTGAKNRNYFEQVIRKKYNKKDTYITVLDINGFKEINDQFGHLTGDHALKTLAGLLAELKGVLEVCRYGGDEFIVVHTAECDLNACNKIFNNLLSYSFCFGTYHKASNENVMAALEEADKILYEHKKIHWTEKDRRKPTNNNEVLTTIADVLVKFRDLRVGQLIANAIDTEKLYYISDRQLAKAIKSFIKTIDVEDEVNE